MEIVFSTKKLHKLCNSSAELQQKYGPKKAKKIQQRIYELQAANTLADVSHLPPLRCHALKGNRDGQFAVTTVDQYRMVFEPAVDLIPRLPDGGIDQTQITAICILEVDIDYHD